MKKLGFRAVDASNWKDLEHLFESRGGPHHCWCMVWREMADGLSRANKADKKSTLKSFMENKLPIGLLCYDEADPIGWCSIAPRALYRELGGTKEEGKVWSLVCFFIKREYRQQGLIKKLIAQAEVYAKKNGADYLEAYPVEKESPSFRFMGFKSTFEAMGFAFKGRAGNRRNVMIKRLE